MDLELKDKWLQPSLVVSSSSYNLFFCPSRLMLCSSLFPLFSHAILSLTCTNSLFNLQFYFDPPLCCLVRCWYSQMSNTLKRYAAGTNSPRMFSEILFLSPSSRSHNCMKVSSKNCHCLMAVYIDLTIKQPLGK